MLKCEICKHEYKDLNGLSYHIGQKHKDITKQEYYDKYLKQGDLEGSCLICGNTTKFIGLKGYNQYCSRKCQCNDPNCLEKRKQTQIKKYGKLYTQTQDFKEKRKQTNLKKYGVEHYSQTDEYKQKIISTSQEKYGTNFVTQSKEFIEKRQKIFESKTQEEKNNIYLKRKNTFLSKYGVEEYFQTQEFKDKAIQTNIERYGVDSYSKTEEFIEKYKSTTNKNYGVDYYTQTDEYKKRKYTTQKRNKSFNSSKIEDVIYDKIKILYPLTIRHFKNDLYPYVCDFYIPDKNLYIECNFHWTHGGHWYNENSEDDKIKINEWYLKNTSYYNNAINTWSKLDVKKRHVAKTYNLNYIVFWNEEDFNLWVSLDYPSGQDWKCEYSWLPNRKLKMTNEFPELKEGKNTVNKIVKIAQFNEIYKQELELWNKNIFNNKKNGGTLQSNLYANRLKYINKNPLQLSDLEILRGLSISGKVQSYSTFDNTGMKQLIEKYNIKSIYDPCAGWGERLVTCAALGVLYKGVDINPVVIEGHKKIIEYYKLDKNKYQVFYLDSGSKELKRNITNEFNTTFTCPPYWNTEIYTEQGAENLSYDEFLLWWKQVIINSNTDLFAYQINQKYKQDMNRVLENLGYEFIEEIILPKKSSHFTREKNGIDNKKEYESIQIFKRKYDGDGNPG